MHLVSEYTEVFATSFGGSDEIVCRLTARVAAKEKGFGWTNGDVWIYLGGTRGRGRMDQHQEAHGCAVKRIYVYPLWRDGQHRLAQNSAPR